MTILLWIIHVFVCLVLILIVLLQSGKGADLAGAFGGGGSQTAFGARGTATFLSKLTTGAAVVFMLTSFSLSIFTARDRKSSIMQGAQTPVKQTSAPKTPAPVQKEPAKPVQQQSPANTTSKP